MQLKELLFIHRKDELYDYASDRLFLSKISKLNKKELINVLNDHMLKEDTMKAMLYILDNESMKIFIRACNNKIDMKDISFHHANKIALTFYGVINDEGYLEIPTDVKELFSKIYKEEYIQEQRKVNWMIQCLHFANRLYYVYPIDILVKLLKKTNYYSENEKEIMEYFNKIDPLYRGAVYIDEEKVLFNFLVDPEKIEQTLIEQDEKPFYIPTKKEIEEFYLKQYIDNIHYQNYFDEFENIEMLEELDKMELFIKISRGENANDILVEELDKIDIESEEEAQYYMSLLQELFNNTRMVSNRGYKPSELRKMYPLDINNLKIVPGSSKVKEMLDNINLDIIDTSLHDGRKAFPNDECPCGSGKKYKDCCMYNDIKKSKMH